MTAFHCILGILKIVKFLGILKKEMIYVLKISADYNLKRAILLLAGDFEK